MSCHKQSVGLTRQSKREIGEWVISRIVVKDKYLQYMVL